MIHTEYRQTCKSYMFYIKRTIKTSKKTHEIPYEHFAVSFPNTTFNFHYPGGSDDEDTNRQ